MRKTEHSWRSCESESIIRVWLLGRQEQGMVMGGEKLIITSGVEMETRRLLGSLERTLEWLIFEFCMRLNSHQIFEQEFHFPPENCTSCASHFQIETILSQSTPFARLINFSFDFSLFSIHFSLVCLSISRKNNFQLFHWIVSFIDYTPLFP